MWGKQDLEARVGLTDLISTKSHGTHQRPGSKSIPGRQKNSAHMLVGAIGKSIILAEREGFEPSDGSPHRLISSQVHSTTLPPLLIRSIYGIKMQ